MTMYESLVKASDFIKKQTKIQPRVGIVLGSGLGAFAEHIDIETTISFESIPGFSKPTIEGHGGKLILGHVGDTPCAVMQGRIHYYEGHTIQQVVFPVRTLGLLGVKKLILTNAAGGLQDDMKPGDLMIMRDHINLMGVNPLMGPNISQLGPRFPDMSNVYSKDIQSLLKQIYSELSLRQCEGVYAAVMGPSYETPSEIQYLKKIGADAVGMSTVPESIAARHMGIEVGGISCITNLAAGLSKHELSHEEVTATGKAVEKNFILLLQKLVTQL